MITLYACKVYSDTESDIDIVNIVLGQGSSQMLGSSASSAAAYGASVPLFYDPDTETDQKAMIVWDIELVGFGELSSDNADNLGSHWGNRELAMEREK